MLTLEEKRQFGEIFETLGETLDITETQYNAAVNSYSAVGDWLAKPESTLAPYKPIIRPQGSFMLGTMVKPINENDDLDIDLVCELTGKDPRWTQYDLKHKVGDRLAANEQYRRMLDDEGRRCWTLIYSNSANYHMDILPSLVCNDYSTILEKAFSGPISQDNFNTLAIRITDNKLPNYHIDPIAENWMKSNPFGYAKWFFNEATLEIHKATMLSRSVKPIPQYQKEKLPLQRVVQILKRHRDMMFNGNEDKPISIIITTLATKAYKKESSILDALVNVVNNMGNYIETRYDQNLRKNIKWIANPVNPEENFADKWVEHPQREINFNRWLTQVGSDIQKVIQQRGLQHVCDAMKNPFGDQSVVKTFSILGEKNYNLRQSGNLMMNTKSGILSSTGTITAASHNFHGKL